MPRITLTPGALGRWALITGGSSGIGRAHAFELAKRGFDLILVGRDVGRLDQTAAELTARYGVAVETMVQDLGKTDGAHQLIAKLGDREIGVLVANAGAASPREFAGGDIDAYITCVNVKVRTLLELTHHIATGMRDRGRGAMLMVSSTTGLQGIASLSNNSATEAYVLNLGESLHHELKPHGVTVTVLLPGPTITPGYLSIAPDPTVRPHGAMTPEATASEGIRALERGRVSHIAGRMNRVTMGLLSRSVRTSLMSRMISQAFQLSTDTRRSRRSERASS